MNGPEPGGGYSEADELFPYAEDEGISASPSTIADMADTIEASGGSLDAFSADVDVAHRPAMTGTAGVLQTLTADAPTATKDNVSQVLAATLCASGATRLFGENGVLAYNGLVDDLRAEYDERKAEIMASDCGVAEVSYPKGTTSSEHTQLDSDRADEVATAREEQIAELVVELRERQAEYRDDPLDAEADTAASRLEEGPTEEVLKELFAAGALPSGTVDAFPGITFKYDEVPSDLEDMTDEELEEYLREHPEASSIVDKLLTKKDLSSDEMSIVEAQARVDADLLKEGLDEDAGADALEAIGAATDRLALINEHLADGGKFTDAAEQYINVWMDDVGADNLTELAGKVSSSLEVARHGHIVDDASLEAYLSPVSEAILNLSNGENYPTGSGSPGLEYMPEAIQELVGIRIGEDGGDYRAGYLDESGLPEMDKVKNLDLFEGWCDLMAASTVEGGEPFSNDLADQAIQAKQDMNAIMEWAGEMSERQTLTGEEWDFLNSSLTDEGSSDLLSVVSRNENASASLLIDDDRRQQILGMNWDDGDGAADVIRAGTDRNPDDGGGTERQAEAALEVMTEIASDPSEYLDRADNESVSDAILDVGITWIDTFGENVSSETSSKYNVDDTDILGRELPFSVTLSQGDQEAFLEFVAASDDDDAIRFEAASQYYGQQLVADALDQDDPDVLDDALEWAGRADGQIRQANLEWAIGDMEEVKNQHERAELLAENRSLAAGKTAATLILSIGGTVGSTAFPPAAPFISVGSAAAGPVIDSLLAENPIPDYEKMELEKVNKALESDALDSTSRRNLLLAQVALMKGHEGDESLYNEDGSLKSPEEIANINKPVNGLDELEALAESVVRDWNSRQEAHNQVDIDQFDAARDDTFAPVRADDDRKNDDGWRDDEKSRRHLYGDNLPEGYGGSEHDDQIEDIYTGDGDKVGESTFD